MVILDTNIIIDHLRLNKSNDLSALDKLASKELRESLAISVISVQELYEGRSTIEVEKESDLLNLITPLSIIQYNYLIAETAGKIARDLKQLIDFADAAIAASAIINNAPLVTLNKKHFIGIKGLTLYKL